MTDQTHNEELITAHLARLKELEKQQARFGYRTDPAVLTEIAEKRAILKALQTFEDLKADSTLEPDRRQDNRLNIMVATVQATVAELATTRKAVRDDIQAVKEDVRAFEVRFSDEFDRLVEASKVFQNMISASMNTFHKDTSTDLLVMRRAIIGLAICAVILILLIKFGAL